MTRLAAGCLGLLSLVTVYLSYVAHSHIPQDLAPQGCRMSWMSPSYVLQTGFNSRWTPLAKRYSLWLYREVGWDPDQLSGRPVLFIPGNAGSSQQVRSIASSAIRQYLQNPGEVAPAFRGLEAKPLDFFAVTALGAVTSLHVDLIVFADSEHFFVVEFNEDLSAFHGPTLQSEIAYTRSAVAYILSLYPGGTSIIVMGHSMGGIVAVSLLPSPEISAIITMSTPHTLPPARFDSRINKLYSANEHTLLHDPTPILSLCGGATDMMIPSESCVLPEVGVSPNVYRRTVFTTGLEGVWTGVGHREMVWCHQVRWRVARAALELGRNSSEGKGAAFDVWMRDGHSPPPQALGGAPEVVLPDASVHPKAKLVLKNPQGSQTHLLPVPSTTTSPKFVAFVSQGAIGSIGPYHRRHLTVSVSFCRRRPAENQMSCSDLHLTSLQLFPNPPENEGFPLPHEGVDESEGVVLYEADIPHSNDEQAWVAVYVGGGEGVGWVVGGFGHIESIESHAPIWSVLHRDISIPIQSKGHRDGFRVDIHLPRLPSNSLFVYQVTPSITPLAECLAEPYFQPVLVHECQQSERHFYPLESQAKGGDRILLHTHSSGPHIPPVHHAKPQGIRLTVYSSTPSGCRCMVQSLEIRLNWFATLGRLAGRYFTAVAAWGIAVTALLFHEAWRSADNGGPFLSVPAALARFMGRMLPKLLLASVIVSFIPLPKYYYLGNGGAPALALIAPFLLALSTGLVWALWWILVLIMWPLGKIGRALSDRRKERLSVGRNTLVSMSIVFLLVLLLVPWQVAFLGCWLIHLYTCATRPYQSAPQPYTPTTPAIEDGSPPDERPRCVSRGSDNREQKMHILLLMTWLLPYVVPILAVWVRTMATAGVITPFNGDHNILNVAPFLILVDFASWTMAPLFPRQRFEGRVSASLVLPVVAITGFAIGSRAPYRVFEAVNIAIGCIVAVRIGPRYWGGLAW